MPTTRAEVWPEWNGRAQLSCKRVQIRMRHFWEHYLHEVLPNQIETYLVKTRSTRSAPRNGVICNNAMFLTARLALWLVGMQNQVEGTHFKMYSKSLSEQHTNFVNITFITVSESKYKTIISRQTITSHQTAMVILCEIWCWLFFDCKSREKNMTDGYLRGAVSQYSASKRNF